MEKKLSVEGMTCEHCVKRVKKIIEKNSSRFWVECQP